MKSLKTVILTVFLSIGFLFPSCDRDPYPVCNCPDVLPYFDIMDLKIHNTEKVKSYSKIIDANQSSISRDSFEGLFLEYLVDYHSNIDFNFSLMNSAIGCSCIDSGYKGSATEKLESIEIITLNDFDDDHPANTSINDLFIMTFETTDQPQLPLDEFLLDNSSLIEFQFLPLRITKAPENDMTFHVNVILKLSTGEEYQAESLPIMLN